MWEDLRRLVNNIPGGYAFLVLFGLMFLFWGSLPDSTKEKVLAKISSDEKGSATNDKSGRIEIPDISKAVRVTRALQISDIAVNRGEVIDNSPKGFDGFFHIDIPPNNGGVYSFSEVLCRGVINPNYFLTCRIAGGDGIKTIELKGLGVVFLLSPCCNQYMIYNSEENLSSWRPLPVKNENPWKTMGIHQVGRHVDVFLNSRYIASYELWNSPVPGKVGVVFKGDPHLGGKAEFQRLAIFEF